MILVIGGRSKIGAELIRLLSVNDQPVRALSRTGEAISDWPIGVQPVAGDRI